MSKHGLEINKMQGVKQDAVDCRTKFCFKMYVLIILSQGPKQSSLSKNFQWNDWEFIPGNSVRKAKASTVFYPAHSLNFTELSKSSWSF